MRRTIVALLILAAAVAPWASARAQNVRQQAPAPGRRASLAPTPGPAHDHPMGALEDYYYPHLHNLVWDPADPRRVFAASPVGGWRSDDAGRTWAPISPDTPNLHYGRALLDAASRTLYLYRWGDPGLYASADFGATWPLRSRAMYYDLALVPGARGALYAIHGDWRLRRSDDGGVTWRDLTQPAAPAPAALAVAPGGELFVATAGKLYSSADGGQRWRAAGEWPDAGPPRRLLVAPDGALVAMPASADAPSVSARALLRSADGGQSWAAAPLPTTRIAVATAGPDGSLYAGSDDGRVWRLTELTRWGEAAAWRELPIQLARPIHLRDDIPYTPVITEISPGPDGAVLIGTIHGVYRSASPDGPALLRARGLLPTAALPGAPVAPVADGRSFAETGHTLREPFLSAWARLGGVALLGLPRTEPFLERNLDSGADEIVQYFERGRLGYPAGRPAQISLGRIGPPLLAERGAAPARQEPRAGCTYFDATGLNLCGDLREAWRAAGGLRTLGLPIMPAEPRGDGEVQWFERGRLERGASGAVALGLVGSEELRARGWLP